MKNRRPQLKNLLFNAVLGLCLIGIGMGLYKYDYTMAGIVLLFIGIFLVAYPKIFKPFNTL